MVLPASHGITRVPRYSGAVDEANPFRTRGYHPLWPDFPDCYSIDWLDDSLELQQKFPDGPTTPIMQRLLAYT